MNHQLNTSFSTKFSTAAGLPLLQLAVDSTSMGAFKTCPRYYYYSIVLGYQPKGENVHLAFGLLMHGALERYHHAKAQGASHDDALDRCLDWTLRATWNYELNRPWDTQDSYKNRFTLVRTLVGYLDKYGANDSLQTVVLANGKPAVELSFSFASGYTSKLTGEPFFVCGHIDRLATLNEVAYIPDVKTTKSELGIRYWNSHDPSNQFMTYMLAGDIVWKFPAKGLVVDACQVIVSESRFERHLITKDAQQLNEFHRGLGANFRHMEECATDAQLASDSGEDPALGYPMRETSCARYNGCEFQGICSKSPMSRKQWLETNFKKRVWDPLQRRGDI